MKVLLAEAPYSYGVNDIAIPKYFPLGLGYIASTLQDKGFEVELLAGLGTVDFYILAKWYFFKINKKNSVKN